MALHSLYQLPACLPEMLRCMRMQQRSSTASWQCCLQKTARQPAASMRIAWALHGPPKAWIVIYVRVGMVAPRRLSTCAQPTHVLHGGLNDAYLGCLGIGPPVLTKTTTTAPDQGAVQCRCMQTSASTRSTHIHKQCSPQTNTHAGGCKLIFKVR